MSKLLISIRSAEEARLVEETDVAILDVKEPNRGGLGASDPETLKEIADSVGGSNQVLSFSAGELVQWVPRSEGFQTSNGIGSAKHPSLAQRYGEELLSQYRFVKIGLAGVTKRDPTEGHDQKFRGPQIPDWRRSWIEFFRDLPSPTRSVAVVYVDFRDCDAPSPRQIVGLASETENCEVVLFDTYYKSGNLFSHISITELGEMVALARAENLTSVVAGSVDLDCLTDVVSVSPDFIGVRGAVCRGARTGEIAPDLVDIFSQELNAVLAN